MKKKNMKTMITRILACALLIATLGLSLASCAAKDKVKDAARKAWDTAVDGAEKIYDAAKDKITAEQTEGFGEIALLSLAGGTETVDDKDVMYQIIQAHVLPDSATDKSTTWEVYWIDNQTGNEDANVTDYVTVMACIGAQPYTAQPGSNWCKVTCKQPFAGSTIGVRVTTVVGGFTAECRVTYEGVPSYLGFHQVLTDGNTQFVDRQLTLTTGTTYTFKLAVDNVFHSVGDKFGNYEIVKCYATGSYVGEVWTSGLGNTGEQKTIDASTLGSLLFGAKIEGDTVSLYDLVSVMDYTYPLSAGAGVRYKSGAENVVYHVDIRDTVSGVVNTLSFQVKSSVTSVSLSESNLVF